MKFIELTNIYEEYCNHFVNTQSISEMVRCKPVEGTHFTLIIMNNGNDLEVKETPEEILEIMRPKKIKPGPKKIMNGPRY